MATPTFALSFASLLLSIAAMAQEPAGATPAEPLTAATVHAGLSATTIFFLSDDAIWTCDGNGRELRQWSTPGTKTPTPLALAPDGRRFALIGTSLTILDADGRTLALGAIDGWGSRPVWSHDGRAIVLGTVRQTVGQGGLWITDDASAEDSVRRLTAVDVYEAEPSFSPDGTHLAFAATLAQEVERSHDVIYVRRKSRVEVLDRQNNKRTIACERTGEIFAVEWSPDGRHLAFEIDGDLCIVPMAASTPGPMRVAAARVRNGVPFCWSKDSAAVLASRNVVPQRYGHDATPAEDALVIAPVRGESRELPLGTTIYDADFAPDGAWIVVTLGNRDLVRVAVATGNRDVLVTGSDHWSPVWWRSAIAGRERTR